QSTGLPPPSVHVDLPAFSVQAVPSWFVRPVVVGVGTPSRGSAMADAGSRYLPTPKLMPPGAVAGRPKFPRSAPVPVLHPPVSNGPACCREIELLPPMLSALPAAQAAGPEPFGLAI